MAGTGDTITDFPFLCLLAGVLDNSPNPAPIHGLTPAEQISRGQTSAVKLHACITYTLPAAHKAGDRNDYPPSTLLLPFFKQPQNPQEIEAQVYDPLCFLSLWHSDLFLTPNASVLCNTVSHQEWYSPKLRAGLIAWVSGITFSVLTCKICIS